MQAKDLIVLGSSRLLGKLYCNDISIGGSASFVSISTTGDITVGGKINVTGSITAKAGVELYHSTPYIDFHFANSTNDYTSRIIESANGTINITPKFSTPDATITTGHITNIASTEIKATNVNVTNKLYALKYDLESVADLGGSFIVAPTLIVPNSTQATDSNASLTVAKSGNTLTLTVKDPSISTNQIAGFTWTQNYKVKVSGKINNVVIGTCTGKISSTNLSGTQMTLSVTCDSNIASLVTAGTYQIANYNLNIMLYNADTSASGETLPIGIWLQSYGLTKNPTIEIWNGQMTTPKVRLGYLNGIVYDKKDTTTNPNGLNQTLGNIWGLYADNAYLEGSVVAKGGRIAGWIIGDGYITSNVNRTSYNASTVGITITKDGIGAGNGTINTFYIKHSDGSMMVKKGSIAGWRIETTYLASGTATAPAADTILLSPSGTSSSYDVGGKNQSGWVLTAGTTFGVDKTGGLYATSANITGSITANSLTIKPNAVVSGLNVGGRNLLLNTASPNSWTISLNSSNYQAHDCYKTYSPIPTLFNTDDLVTVSFDWSTTATDGSFHVEAGTVTPYVWGTVINAIGGRANNSNYVDISSTNTSGHFIVTFKVTSAVASAATTLQYLRIRIDGANTSGKTFTVSNAKAEKGGAATDWTPAPEDVEAEINAKKSIYTLNTTYSYSYTDILTYSAEGYGGTAGAAWNVTSSTGVKEGDTVRLKVTVSNMNNAIVYVIGTVTNVPSTTQIKMTSHGLDTTVIDGGHILTGTIDANKVNISNLTVGAMTQTEQNKILNSNIQVGGRNLLKAIPVWHNSDGYNPYRFTLTENLKAGKTYTIQFWNVDISNSGKTAATLGISAYWGGGWISLASFIGTSYFTNGHADYLTSTFTVTADQASGNGATNLWIDIWNSPPNVDGSTRSMTIERVKLEEGNIPSSWSPAQEDIDVGGKNLLIGTGTPVSKATTATSSFVTQALYNTPNSVTLESLGFEVGDEMTLSFDWAITSASTYGWATIEYYGVTSSSTDAYIAALAYQFEKFSSSKLSGHFVKTVSLTSATIKTKRLIVRIDNSNLTLTISNLKFEKGNKATDWTPAPEDIDVNKYITTISGTNGISVHNVNDENNFVNINSNGMSVYKDGKADANKVAFFGSDVQIGASNTGHVNVHSKGMDVFSKTDAGTLNLAHFGYDLGTSASGEENSAPYYTFGTRKTTTTAYSNSSTYTIGDLCVHDNKIYTCIMDIRTPGEWDSNYWRLRIGNYSFAEGYDIIASASYSHGEGYDTKASGSYSHAEGYQTHAGYPMSHAEGWGTLTQGIGSHAGGRGTIAAEDYQTVIGTYNKYLDNDNFFLNYAFIIGNGNSKEDRSNAFAVDWNGNAYCYPKTISLGSYVASGILTNNGGQIMFSIPLGRVLPSNASISKITFIVVARVANANGIGYYCVKGSSGGTGTVAFDSSATKTFYDAGNNSRSLTAAMWNKSIQGGANLYIDWNPGTSYFFAGTSTINGYVNNNPVVIYLNNIVVTLAYS